MAGISLVGAQLRYDIESLLQEFRRRPVDHQQQQHFLQAHQLDDAVPRRMVLSKASELENELLRREISDVKERNEKQGRELRTKEAQLRMAIEEAKRERHGRMAAEASKEKGDIDSKSVDRLVSMVRAELDAVRASAATLANATEGKDVECTTLVSEVDDLTRHLAQQERMLAAKAAEGGALGMQVQALKGEVVAARAAAALAENAAGHAQVTLSHATDKCQRFELQLADADGQLSQERKLVATLRSTAAAAEAAAAAAAAAVLGAAGTHAELLVQLQDRENDLMMLKAATLTVHGGVDDAAVGVKRARVEGDRFSSSLSPSLGGAAATAATAAGGGGDVAAALSPPIAAAVRGSNTNTNADTSGLSKSNDHTISAPVAKLPSLAQAARVHIVSSCPMCSEAAYGLMLSCSSCQRCIHSSCARKLGHDKSKDSGPLLCPACVA